MKGQNSDRLLEELTEDSEAVVESDDDGFGVGGEDAAVVEVA